MPLNRATGESKKMLAELNQSKVRFAHWKGNSHLLQSLEGKTDIEILIYPDDRIQFESIMKKLGCKKLVSQAWNRFPNVEDWIGFDYETGNLLHLHTHYALVTGLKYGKHLFFPWIEEFFRHLQTDPETGWPIPVPELETIMLFIRIGAKMQTDEPRISASKQMELIKLLTNTKVEHLISTCNDLNLEVPEDLTLRIGKIQRENNLSEIINLSEYFYTQLPTDGQSKGAFSSLKSFYYKYYLKTVRLSSRFIGPVTYKKTICNGGKIIALIGSDGSGKSTLSNDLVEWLTFKIDTHYFYLGKKPYIKSYSKRLHSKTAILTNKNRFSKLLRKLTGRFYQILIARQKCEMLQLAKRLSKQGSMIICDRFPQKDILSFNDGPKLQKTGGFYAKLEMKLFNRITNPGADLVFRLNVSPEIAAKRKPEHDYDSIIQKCNNLGKMQFSNSIMIDVDANQSYDVVLLELKREIWKNM